MHAAARRTCNGFWHKTGVQAVLRRNGTNDRFKGNKVICRPHGGAVPEIDLVLPRPLLVVTGLRGEAHFF
ncbi:hypothetical protein SDC9_166655 [bioreactor metagenome]|uniref:Uncharacterized protein n=1 Tax=bioreactor metagenome TaxID=1076179 RepID=A0A645FXM6_9ZZZZ